MNPNQATVPLTTCPSRCCAAMYSPFNLLSNSASFAFRTSSISSKEALSELNPSLPALASFPVVPCAPLEDARGCGLGYAFRNIELEENGFGGV